MKKTLALLLTLTMLVSCFCISAYAEGLTGELTVCVLPAWIDETADAAKVHLDILKAYEEANPGVKLNLQGIAATDIKESFQTAALAGAGPDVVVMDNCGHAIDLAAMGLLLPLSNFTTAEELESVYQPGPLNSGKFEGEYYSVPWHMDCCGLFANLDHLNACGLEVPETWEDLENCLKVLKENGYGGIITYKSAYAFYPFFYQNGCPVIDTTGEVPVVVVDNEAGKEAWNYVCKLITEYDGLVESFKEASSWDKVYESFANGEATFLLGGDWCKRGVNKLQTGVNYQITDMVMGKNRATVLGGWTWNINVNTKNPELAYDFIRYITGEAGDPYVLAAGRNSTRKDWDIDKALSGENEDLKVLADQFGYTMPRPGIINEKAIDEIIVNNILSVIYGQADADTALANLAQELRDNIESNYGE